MVWLIWSLEGRNKENEDEPLDKSNKKNDRDKMVFFSHLN